MRIFFYARVDSKDRSLERQISVAKEIEFADEYIFIEKASGKDKDPAGARAGIRRSRSLKTDTSAL